MVELADHAVEQVAQRCGMAVPTFAAAQVVLACGAVEASINEGPDEADDGQMVVLHAWVRWTLRPETRMTGAEPA